MDKSNDIQNRHRKEEWEVIEEGCRVTTVIPTGNKEIKKIKNKNRRWVNGEVTLQSSTTPPTLPSCVYSFNLFIGSEEVLFSFSVIDIYQYP